ncbi:MAG: hypothetical protein ACOZHQ_13335 [Thermodesulfobacteriota bacterium]
MRHLPKSLTLALCLTALAVAAPSPADPGAPPALRGVKAVTVVVTGISPEAERDGLKRSDLQHDVEERLREGGIKVLAASERLQAPGQPHLMVRFIDQKRSEMDFYAISIAVHLVQNVRLARDNKVVVPAETWGMTGVISVGAQELVSVRNLLLEYVDMFIKEAHAANAARPASPARP